MFRILLITIIPFLGFSQSNYRHLIEDQSINFYDVCKVADEYFKNIDKNQKGSGWNEYQRWKSENEGHFFPDGIRNQYNYYSPAESYINFLSDNRINVRQKQNTWRDLGPYSASNITTGYNPGIGRVETFWVDRLNSDLIYMGSRSGGFWKSLDAGISWKNTTDFLIASGVNTLDVDPFNNQEILINLRNANNGTSHGVYRSVNGGESWSETAFNPKNNWGGLGTNHAINIIKFHPKIKNVIFLGTSRGLYRSSDNLTSWTNSFSTGNITDIQFHPFDPNIIYIFNNGSTANRNVIQISTDGGLSFKPSGTISNNNSARGRISVTPKAPDYIFFASDNGVWKSINKGQSFTFLSKPVNTCSGFSVSDVNEKTILFGNVDIEVSWNEGLSFTQVTSWANTNPDHTYTHADLRIADCVNGVFYVGTDGYLCKSEDEGRTWIRLNDGTGIREFYRLGICQSDVNYHIAGSQDNGTSISFDNIWTEWNGGDGMEAIIFPLNPDVMIGSWQYGTRNITYNLGLTREGINTPDAGSDNADWIAPILMDPSNHYHIYHFGFNVNRNSIFGNPTSWDTISKPNINKIKHAVIAENNSNIFIICKDSSLRISTNKGITWKSINKGLPAYSISDIVFDPRRDSTIVISYDRYQNDGQKIFISHDLGNTWLNITANLNNMPIRCLAIDNTSSSIIYVGGEIGVYYKKMTDTLWSLYNEQLPNVTIRDFEIHQGANKLKAVTWGRGLWEIPLINRENYPSIEIVQTSDKINVQQNIPINQHQSISAQITYTDSIRSVYVLYGNEKFKLNNKIEMEPMNKRWITKTKLLADAGSKFIFFKVVAIGQRLDTSETYTFMYELGPCSSNTKDISIRACESVKIDTFEISESKIIKTKARDQYGCDSTTVIHIKIDNRPESMIEIISDTIFAKQDSSHQYQWYTCLPEWNPINDATNDYYVPRSNGHYGLIIKNGNCEDTSQCISYITTKNYNPIESKEYFIIPNPAKNLFSIISDQREESVNVSIFDLFGRLVIIYPNIQLHTDIPFNLPSGLYNVIIANEKKQFFQKWLVY